jgi:hypothetical protein
MLGDEVVEAVDIQFIKVDLALDERVELESEEWKEQEGGDNLFHRELGKLEKWKSQRDKLLRRKVKFELMTNFYKKPINACMNCPNFLHQFKEWMINYSFQVDLGVDLGVEVRRENERVNRNLVRVIDEVIEYICRREKFIIDHPPGDETPVFEIGEISSNKNDISHLAYWVTRFREEKINETFNTFSTKLSTSQVRPRPFMKWFFSRSYEFFYSKMTSPYFHHGQEGGLDVRICEMVFKGKVIRELIESSDGGVEKFAHTTFKYENDAGMMVSRIRRMGELGPYSSPS